MSGSRGSFVAGLALLAVAASPAAQETAPVAAEDAIDLAMIALPMRAAVGERAWVPVVIEIDGDDLFVGAEGDDATPAQAEVVLHAFDAAGEVVDSATHTVTLAGAAAADEAAIRGVKLMTALALPAGSYSVRALARAAATGRAGSKTIEVSVPEGAIALLPPLVPERPEPWLLAQGPRPELASLAPRPPFVIEGQSFIPAARPTIAAGDGLPVVLMGYDLRDRESEIVATVRDVDGREITGTRLLISPARPALDGVDRILGVLQLPALEAGDYRLEIHGLEGAAPRATAFRVAAAGDATSTLLGVVAPTTPTAATAAIQAFDAPVPGVADADLVAGYRRLLCQLEGGDQRRMAAEVAAFEAAVLAAAGPARLRSLAKSELEVVGELAARDPEALVPLLMLHHDLTLLHKKTRRTHLVHHSVAVVLDVAARYVRANASDSARIIAAQALASLGGHLQASIEQLGVMLFEQALEYHPDHASALLGLAAFPEKHGGPYDQAVRYLRRLVEVHPDNREGRLRLAINLLRLEVAEGGARHIVQATGHLEALVAGPEGDWIYVLAAQELARLRARQGELSEAVEVLRAAAERVPEAQKLRIQLAFLYDRAGRPSDAQAILADIGEVLAIGDPARARYNQWPHHALSFDRASLHAGAAEREGLLAALALQIDGGSMR